LSVSLAANVGFLFGSTPKPYFGDAYAERKQYEDLKSDLKKQNSSGGEGVQSDTTMQKSQ
jgi:hypothetical protein